VNHKRAVSAEQLLGALKKLGYVELSRSGTHALLQHDEEPIHRLTVPAQGQWQAAALDALAAEIAYRRSIALETLQYLL